MAIRDSRWKLTFWVLWLPAVAASLSGHQIWPIVLQYRWAGYRRQWPGWSSSWPSSCSCPPRGAAPYPWDLAKRRSCCGSGSGSSDRHIGGSAAPGSLLSGRALSCRSAWPPPRHRRSPRCRRFPRSGTDPRCSASSARSRRIGPRPWPKWVQGIRWAAPALFRRVLGWSWWPLAWSWFALPTWWCTSQGRCPDVWSTWTCYSASWASVWSPSIAGTAVQLLSAAFSAAEPAPPAAPGWPGAPFPRTQPVGDSAVCWACSGGTACPPPPGSSWRDCRSSGGGWDCRCWRWWWSCR